eukprot:2291137-Pyramimonas_sp.AAC.1
MKGAQIHPLLSPDGAIDRTPPSDLYKITLALREQFRGHPQQKVVCQDGDDAPPLSLVRQRMAEQTPQKPAINLLPRQSGRPALRGAEPDAFQNDIL